MGGQDGAGPGAGEDRFKVSKTLHIPVPSKCPMNCEGLPAPRRRPTNRGLMAGKRCSDTGSRESYKDTKMVACSFLVCMRGTVGG
jgi:hypothetical protein